ncbi:MAG TPA: hypothetical protein DCW41_01590 [Clostridiales bacterium]|nr:hypothetical protein [Clostridiales bacterium]
MSEERFDNNGYDNEDNNGKQITSVKQLVLMIGSFFGLIFAIGIVSKIPGAEWILGLLVAVLFTGAGVFALKSTRGASMLPVVFIVVGVLVGVFSVISKFFPDMRNNMPTWVIGAILIGIGALMIVYPIVALIVIKNKYKASVDATCVRLDIHRSSGGSHHRHTHTYRPVYEFTYSGRKYTVKDDYFSTGLGMSTGDVRELLIDEDDPTKFYDLAALQARARFPNIAAIICIILGIIVVIIG